MDSELIRGDNGIFDVVVDGELVFSKDRVGRFPENAGESTRQASAPKDSSSVMR